MPTAKRALVVTDGGISQITDTDSLVNLPFPLAAPLVTHIPNIGVHTGLTRNGNSVVCHGGFDVSIAGLAEEYRTNPIYRCRLILLRHKPATRKLTRYSGYKQKGAGIYHPSPFLTYGGGSGSGGIGGGGGGGSVPRPSEWSVIPDGPFPGLDFSRSFRLRIGDVFSPWFEFKDDITDAYQAASTHLNLRSLCYFIGNNKRTSVRGIFSHNRGPFLGVFHFAYQIWDQVKARWVRGPLSEPVFIQPAIWPIVEDATTPYPYKRRISLPQRDGHQELVGSVESRRTLSIAGRAGF
jgi:hypothetical protein